MFGTEPMGLLAGGAGVVVGIGSGGAGGGVG